MEEFSQVLSHIKIFIPNISKEKVEVSRATVGWHIEHCLLIINSSLVGLTKTSPTNYKPVFSLKKSVFLWFQYIPRGKIQAPKPFVPIGVPTEERVLALLDEAQLHLKNIKELHKNSFIQHPLLGPLNKDATLKFLKVHTHHHVKIIHEILRAPF